MSATVELEQPQKKRAELEDECASLDQKIQAMKEDVRKLEEEVTAKLEEKVRAKRAAFEILESTKKDFEKKIEELRKDQAFSLPSNEPTSEAKEKKEESWSMPVLCRYCGSENITGAVFCENCGKKIG
jgi:chromosome segregation ATPase